MNRPDLVYYPDDRPGISRRRAGRGWSYLAADGTRIDCTRERARIAALAVPPAYEDVWISPRIRGHLQATGRDARARKQYRYHAAFREWREQVKFDELPAFGAGLPRLRRRVATALGGDVGDRDFAIAAALRLIDRQSIRIGDPAYARENGTQGATTLKDRNVVLDGEGVQLNWVAKGGRKVRRRLTDRRLARAIERLADLPGAPLFEWMEGRERFSVRAEHVNDWLREASGVEGATAKTFRTWNGSAAALEAAIRAGEGVTIKAMAEAASEELHNTPAIARRSYVHPEVIGLAQGWREIAVPDGPDGLRIGERALLELIG